jgi:hypothetical protein
MRAKIHSCTNRRRPAREPRLTTLRSRLGLAAIAASLLVPLTATTANAAPPATDHFTCQAHGAQAGNQSIASVGHPNTACTPETATLTPVEGQSVTQCDFEYTWDCYRVAFSGQHVRAWTSTWNHTSSVGAGGFAEWTDLSAFVGGTTQYSLGYFWFSASEVKSAALMTCTDSTGSSSVSGLRIYDPVGVGVPLDVPPTTNYLVIPLSNGWRLELNVTDRVTNSQRTSITQTAIRITKVGGESTSIGVAKSGTNGQPCATTSVS